MARTRSKPVTDETQDPQMNDETQDPQVNDETEDLEDNLSYEYVLVDGLYTCTVCGGQKSCGIYRELICTDSSNKFPNCPRRAD